MKLILVLLMSAACSYKMPPQELKKLTVVCDNNKGLKYIRIYDDRPTGAHCNDGAEFYLRGEQ